MKAILLEAPDQYKYTDVPDAECDDSGILVKVKAVGLCGSDLRTLKSGHHHVKLPAVIGHEVAGDVIETGKDYCGEFKVGDAVAIAPVVYCGVCDFCAAGKYQYCENIRELAQNWQGGFAEYIAIPPEALIHGNIQLVPEGMDYAHAAITEPPSSCINAQERLAVGIEDTIVIIGAGPIGCMHICVSKARGARKIIIADVNENRLKMAVQFDPDDIINTSETDLVETVMDMTKGKGAEVVITANPVGATQVQAVELAKKAGRIAFFGGLPHGKSTPPIDTNLIHYKGLNVIGTSTFMPKHNRIALDLIRRGLIPADKLITHRLSLKEFHKGVELAASGEALKVVFEF